MTGTRGPVLLGVGCDTEAASRMERLLGEGSRLLERWFTAGERAWIRQVQERSGQADRAALVFTLKEAAIKALWPHLPLLPDAIEVRQPDLGAGQASLALTRDSLSGLWLEARFRFVAGSREATVTAWTTDHTDHTDPTPA